MKKNSELMQRELNMKIRQLRVMIKINYYFSSSIYHIQIMIWYLKIWNAVCYQQYRKVWN